MIGSSDVPPHFRQSIRRRLSASQPARCPLRFIEMETCLSLVHRFLGWPPPRFLSLAELTQKLSITVSPANPRSCIAVIFVVTAVARLLSDSGSKRIDRGCERSYSNGTLNSFTFYGREMGCYKITNSGCKLLQRVRNRTGAVHKMGQARRCNSKCTVLSGELSSASSSLSLPFRFHFPASRRTRRKW
jgi:hypothetical protein